MIVSQLKDFINAGLVDQIKFNPVENGFEVWIVNFDNLIDFSGNLLLTERSAKAKTYTSLDRAYKAFNELGFNGTYILETPNK